MKTSALFFIGLTGLSRRGENPAVTYCPAAAWSKATKSSLSSFWLFETSDLAEEGMIGRLAQLDCR